MPKVSVIVPNYNHSKFLEQRLDSIYGQVYDDFEVILLDDCSQDNSLQILQAYAEKPNTIFAPNKENSGSVFRQWCKGVNLSTGEYIWIAESDDFASPFFLQRLVKVMDKNPNVGLAYSQSWLINTQGNILCDATCWTNDLDLERWKKEYINSGINEICRFLVHKNTLPNASAVLIRRDALERSGGVTTEYFRLCGDWIQWIKLLGVSDIAFVPECLNYWRQKSSNVRASSPGTLEWLEGEQVLRQACSILGLHEQEQDSILLTFLRRCWQWQREYIDTLNKEELSFGT